MAEENSMYAWPRLVRDKDLVQWAGNLADRLQRLETAARKVIYMQSPNGTKWAVTVSDAGVLTVTVA
jgi:hypothetical protein